jgi:hypothetical protein
MKQEAGKLAYELDWEFVEEMARRMSVGKGKYEPYNWQNPIDVEKLKQALCRHFIEVMKGNYEDEGQQYGHIVAVSVNCMLIMYQMKNHGYPKKTREGGTPELNARDYKDDPQRL